LKPPLWPNITLQSRQGVPTLHRDGKPWFGWGAQRPICGEHYEAFERLASQGLRQFHVDATCSEDIYHPELRFWHGPDQFDGSFQQNHFQRLAEICPDALLQLRIYAGAPPWWLEQHPDHCQVFADGHVEHEVQRGGKRKLPSLASPLWRAEACRALKTYIEWLVESGWSRRVSALFLGYGITWEWGLLGSDDFLDYSEHGQRYFREWRIRHGREPVPVPSAERRMQAAPRPQDVIDHQQSLSDMNADYLLALADTAKSASNNHALVGTFYGYTLTAREHSRFMGQYGAGGFQGGHHSLGRVLRSPSVDFLASPFNYCDRALGSGLLFEHVPLASLHAHGKAFFDENDLWAWNNPPQFEAKTLSVGHTPNIEQTILAYRLAFMQAIVRGKHQWLTELTHWIGPFGENFSDPQLLAEIKRLNALAEELIHRDRSPVTEIAFILDEKSVAHLSLDNTGFRERIYRGSVGWGHLGAPFDVLLLDDLLDLRDVRYKLVIAAFVKAPGAIRQLEDWSRSHPHVALTDQLERSDVHRYVEEPVTVWANATMVGVHVDRAGTRTVRFRSPAKGVEAFSGKSFDAPSGLLSWSFQEKDVALFTTA
jgi:hypothetical protein